MKINNEIHLDQSEVVESFSKSSGPGGQHVNKVETRVELRYLAKKSLNISESVKARLKLIAGKKWNSNGEIVIIAEKYRSQAQNRELAKLKLIKLILKALPEPTNRIKTKPSRAVKIRRANSKIKRSEVKALRNRIKV